MRVPAARASGSPGLTVEITSFSFKASLPPHLFSTEDARHGGGFVFDCRSLPNPGRDERFQSRTGLDPEVRAFLDASGEVARFRESAFDLVELAVASFLERSLTFLGASFGCTGGQHRSVYLAEQLSRHLIERFAPRVETRVVHHSLAAKGLLPP